MNTDQTQKTTAELIVDRLLAQGVTRIYGLCGGHIQPIWDAAARAGIDIVDVRHEGSAVYMAQAESELSGQVGVALVTAGPGLTNAVTAIANASTSSNPVLVLSGRTPRPQSGMAAMQDLPQSEIVAPLCRQTENVQQSHHVLPRMDSVIAAALGETTGSPGPSYIDFPTDLLEQSVHAADIVQTQLRKRTPTVISPDVNVIDDAAHLIQQCRRILVIGGAPIRSAINELQDFLRQTGAVYLDSAQSRGALPADDPAYVPAMRGRVMREADLVITIGKRLDFQLGYGSPSVFENSPSFIRIGRSFEELAENRRGDVEIRADIAPALSTFVERSNEPHNVDSAWLQEIRAANDKRTRRLQDTLANPDDGADGRMHPYRLIHAINRHLNSNSTVVADGGDILSFARVGLNPVRYLDCGALGCLGIGVPFGVSAALNTSSGPVIALIGDGSFGFTAMEVDTAVRRNAPVLFVIANNEAWNIERQDQMDRFDHNLVGVELPGCRYDLLARGLGAYAERVDDPEELDAAIERCLERRPALLDVLVTKDALSPDYQNGLASVPAWHALTSWSAAEVERRR